MRVRVEFHHLRAVPQEPAPEEDVREVDIAHVDHKVEHLADKVLKRFRNSWTRPLSHFGGWEKGSGIFFSASFAIFTSLGKVGMVISVGHSFFHVPFSSSSHLYEISGIVVKSAGKVARILFGDGLFEQSCLHVLEGSLVVRTQHQTSLRVFSWFEETGKEREWKSI